VFKYYLKELRKSYFINTFSLLIQQLQKKCKEEREVSPRVSQTFSSSC